MLPICLPSIRGITTTAMNCGKKNFRKFQLFNKRGSRLFKEMQAKHHRGVREIGYLDGDKFVAIPEMIPELIVPDLSDFKLKPYVSYRAQDVTQSEFTSEDLFNEVYAPKIICDFKGGKLDEAGLPTEASPEEKLTPEEAILKARQTGTDLFCSRDRT